MSSYKILYNDSEGIKKALAKGLVGGYIYCSENFYAYAGGIIRKDANCANIGRQVNHAITFVGYGSENGVDYWLIVRVIS
jgi:cathepsin L